MRHIAAGLLIIALSFGLIQAATPAAAQDEYLIGLVTDIGPVDDRSFNQSAWEGAKAAAEMFNGVADFIETTDTADYANNILIFAEQEYDIIITVGFALGDATLDAAEKFPKTHFIGVDIDAKSLMEQKKVNLPNFTGLVFREDKMGFLAGVLAARMTKSNVIAAVLPADLPPVVRFKDGFEAGAKYVNAEIRLLSTFYPGTIVTAFDDPAWGAATASQAIDQGADVIFSGGGKTGNGGLQEVAKRTTVDKPLYCIGVDTDQWFTVPEAQPCLIVSATKSIAEGVMEIITQVREGKITEGGNFEGKVALSDFHDFEDIVPQAVKDELKQLEIELNEGKLNPDGTRP
ncbi:MAG: hypothetical protein OHK0023_19290 [Anaerolineae bacterium]